MTGTEVVLGLSRWATVRLADISHAEVRAWVAALTSVWVDSSAGAR